MKSLQTATDHTLRTPRGLTEETPTWHDAISTALTIAPQALAAAFEPARQPFPWRLLPLLA